MKTRAEEFLKRHGLSVDGIDREGLLKNFAVQMADGLAGRKSSLMMIPSFVSPDNPVKTGTPVVVLDAGGTNLRAAVVQISAEGRPEIGSFFKRPMPGSQGALSADAFYDAFAEFLMPVVEASDTIGFCFSYPAEITPDCDARLLHWSKQIEVPAVVGTMIGAGLLEHLRKRGYERRTVVLNDTVATLLAGKSAGVARDYSTYVGFILGTGTNIAYTERNERITKRSDLKPGGTMVINCETGAFNGAEQSFFDRQMDADTNDCGHYTFEKMISGAYLGRIGLTVLRQAVAEGFFSEPAAALINSWRTVSNKDLDDFCGGSPAEDNPFLDPAFNEPDQGAAVLAAVNIAAAVIQTGEGHNPARPVCVNIDGSTYHRTRTGQFRNRVQEELVDMLGSRGIAYELIRVDESPVIGAAVAGLM